MSRVSTGSMVESLMKRFTLAIPALESLFNIAAMTG
jgi:hypothetical protein